MKTVRQARARRSRPDEPARAGGFSPPNSPDAPGSNYWLLVGLVFFSGFAALVYELLWFRQLGLVFGNTVQAAATVLTAFMAGLAAGAYGARRWVARLQNPVLWFGVLEAGIGLYALVVPAAFAGVSAAYKAMAVDAHSGSMLLTGLRFLLALLVLFVPTALMGASLPVLSEAALRSRERFATRLGLLYGCNTAGATLGVLACGFLLVPGWGVRTTNLAAAGLNMLIGLLAFLLARSSKPAPGAAPAAAPSNPTALGAAGLETGAGGLLLSVAALCGFLALAFETVWFRALVLVFGSTSHSFAIMVGCFLLGLVIGSAALGRLAENPGRAAWALAISLVGTGLWTFSSLLAYQAAPEYFLRSLVRFDFSYTGMLVAKTATASVFLLPLAIFSGLAFTAVVRLIRDRTASSGQAVGSAFSVNALGSAAGSALGGFVLLPACGLERSLQILGGAGILLGLLVLWRSVEAPQKHRLAFCGVACALAAGLFAFVPRWDPLLLCSGPYFTPRTHVQGKTLCCGRISPRWSFSSIVKEPRPRCRSLAAWKGGLYYSSEGKTEADTSPQSMVLQRMMGHLPMLIHPNPRRALNIGLGAGVTSGALSCYPDVKIDIADIEPAVTNVAAIWAERNHYLIERGGFTLFINDGRNHLLVTTNRYDVITSDPFEPVMAGAASLYTSRTLPTGQVPIGAGRHHGAVPSAV